MTHFIFDCDDVLLDWITAFTKWLPKVGFNPDPDGPNTWDLSEWLGTNKTYTRRLVQQFSMSKEFASLAPVENARETVLTLKQAGHMCSVLTACGDDAQTAQARFHNLHMCFDQRFTKHTFASIKCIPLGASKFDHLRRYSAVKDSVVFVEDSYKNALDGVAVGLKTYCIRKRHNRQDEAKDNLSGVIWIDDISEVRA